MSQRYHHGSLRTALIDAAEVVLERDGIEALTLRAVARQAGVSHAAPTHHFGDLTGLLTELVASGFVRFRKHMLEVIEAGNRKKVPLDKKAKLLALGRAYIGFARTYPGLFLLMFRSERLDWSTPALFDAGQAAFALLDNFESGDGEAGYKDDKPLDFQTLVKATTRWSLMHGLATLLVDGRLGPTAQKVPGTDVDKLIEQVLLQGLITE